MNMARMLSPISYRRMCMRRSLRRRVVGSEKGYEVYDDLRETVAPDSCGNLSDVQLAILPRFIYCSCARNLNIRTTVLCIHSAGSKVDRPSDVVSSEVESAQPCEKRLA